MNDDEKLPFVRNEIKRGYNMMCEGIYNMLTHRLLTDEELLVVLQKELDFDNLIYDGNPPENSWSAANHYYKSASLYARLGRFDNIINSLRRAAVCAQNFDNRPEVEEASYVLLGKMTYRKTDTETSDSRPLREIMRDKWLASRDFDSFRDSAEFREITAMLS